MKKILMLKSTRMKFMHLMLHTATGILNYDKFEMNLGEKKEISGQTIKQKLQIKNKHEIKTPRFILAI